MAPEILNSTYTTKCDMYSLGVIVFLLASGTLPIEGRQDEVRIDKANYSIDWTNDFWEEHDVEEL